MYYLFSLVLMFFLRHYHEALLQAYNENPVLNAERENIKVSLEEELKISKGQFLPSVTLSVLSKSQENTEKQTDSSGANCCNYRC